MNNKLIKVASLGKRTIDKKLFSSLRTIKQIPQTQVDSYRIPTKALSSRERKINIIRIRVGSIENIKNLLEKTIRSE